MTTTAKKLRAKVVDTAKSYLGAKQGSAKHKKIIDTFNTVKPEGCTMTYTAYWCAAFASADAILALGADYAKKYFPLSCNCEHIITIAKKLKIWKESDAYVPDPGDWMLYDWEDNGKGDNKGGPNHVGIVETASKKEILVIEGNKNKAVGERKVPVNGHYIRGFVTPDYKAMAEAKNKEARKPTSKNGQKLADAAKDFCYAYDPKLKKAHGVPDKAKYPGGHPKEAYKKALNKVYPDRSKWSDAPKKGASCDVLAGTIFRSTGIDKKFPRSLSQQYGRLEKLVKKGKLEEIKNPTVGKLKDGDCIIYKRMEGKVEKGHICFFVDGMIKHASYNRYYGRTTNNAKSILNMKKKKELHVYRAK